MPPANVAFLPWVRQGAAAAVTTPDALVAQTVSLTLSASLTVNSTPPVQANVRLLGPGDVVGIDPHQIVRTDPRPGTADFEPNYLAAIEFDRPDYPWLFTPAAATGQHQLRPWLVLIVVPAAQPGITLLPPGEGPLPILDIRDPAKPAEELPDLNDSWCWAHAQASRANGIDVAGALNGSPELSLSRLVCPRLLKPQTDYLACVVPAFDIGSRAGLGDDLHDGELGQLAPSWVIHPAPEAVRVPVYFQWSFRTGSGEDFESLVRLLKAEAAPPGLGSRSIDISKPGFILESGFPDGAILPVGGALQPMKTGDGPALDWPPDTKVAFQIALLPIVNAAGNVQTTAPGSDPLLAPPLYGRWHAARPTVNAGIDTVWFDLLNADPRHRVIAALGTRVVQEHQEALMASAWEQAADLQRANQRLRQLQLGLAVNSSLYARHFDRMGAEALMRVSGPAIARVRPGADTHATALTLLGDLSGSALPPNAMSAAMRRLVRPRGPIGRRFTQMTGGAAFFLTRMNNGDSGFVSPRPSDVLTFEQIRQHLSSPDVVRPYREVTGELIAAQPPRMFSVRPEGQPVPVLIANTTADSTDAAAFRAAARDHLNAVDPARPTIIFAPPPRHDLDALRAGVLAQVRPARTLTAFARVVTGGKSDPRPSMAALLPPGAPSAPMPEIEPVMTAPTFPQAMYAPLRDLSQELLLPGIERVLPNSVIGLETNRRFVEAYMVGLNHEMGRELLWRGYPTDQRGTCFAQFWDTSAAPLPRLDIMPLHQWGNRALGAAEGGPDRERFVMLIRSELLRRYPTAIVYAVKAIPATGGVPRHPSDAAADEAYPAFRGSLDPDLTFFGFDLTVDDVIGDQAAAGYYIVIQEQPTEPRFGLDVGTNSGDATHLHSGHMPPDIGQANLTWGRNAAHTAALLRQLPVRVAIHASQFVAKA